MINEIDVNQVAVGALRPGVAFALQRLHQIMDELNALVGEAGSVRDTLNGAKRVGRPSGGRNKTPGPWTNMTKEERSAEMKRRFKVRQQNRAALEGRKIPGLHPRDPKHPGHDAWVAKLRKSQKRLWNSLTPAQQKAKIDHMLRREGNGKKAAA